MGQTLRTRLRHSSVVALALTGLLLSGCAAGAGEAAGPSGNLDLNAIQARVKEATTTPTAILQTKPVKTPPKDVSVIFLTNGLGGTTRIMQGVQEATKALGWKFDSISFDTANPATLSAAYLTALSKGANFVIQSGTPQSNIAQSTLDAYKQANAKIILTSVSPFKSTDVVLGNPNGVSMQETSGQMLADWFMADSKGTGKVLVESASAFPVLVDTVNAFKSRVGSDCPDCTTKVLDIAADQIASGGIVPSIVNTLRANPDINYVMFDNLQFGNGIQSALAAAGLSNVKVFGRAVDPNSAAGIANGTIAAGTGTSYAYTGYAAIDIAVRSLAGQDVSAVQNDNQPTQLITKANLASIDSKGLWNQPSDALAQFSRLWGVKPSS